MGGSYATAITVATFVWAWLLIVAALVKVVAYDMAQFFMHFTNWAWLYSAFFFLLVLGFSRSAYSEKTRERDARARTENPVVELSSEPTARGCCHVQCAATVVAVLFFPLFAIVWFVSIAVFVLLLVNPAFITDVFMKLAPGVVMVANDVFHIVPVFAIVFFAFIHGHLIWFALNRTCSRASPCGRFLYCNYATWCGAVTLFALYLLVLWVFYGMTANDVYGIDADIAYAFLSLAGVGILVNGLVMWCAHCRKSLWVEDVGLARYHEAQAMLKTDEELFDTPERQNEVQLALRRHLSDQATALMMPLPVVRHLALYDVDEYDTTPQAQVIVTASSAAEPSRVRRRRQYDWV